MASRKARPALRATAPGALGVAFEHAPFGIAVLAPRDDFPVVAANRTFCDLLRNDEATLIATSRARRTGDRRVEVAQLQRLVDGTASSYTVETTYPRGDGSSFTGRLHVVAARDTNGAVEHLVAFMEDIDARQSAHEGYHAAAE